MEKRERREYKQFHTKNIIQVTKESCNSSERIYKGANIITENLTEHIHGIAKRACWKTKNRGRLERDRGQERERDSVSQIGRYTNNSLAPDGLLGTFVLQSGQVVLRSRKMSSWSSSSLSSSYLDCKKYYLRQKNLYSF